MRFCVTQQSVSVFPFLLEIIEILFREEGDSAGEHLRSCYNNGLVHKLISIKFLNARSPDYVTTT